ERKLSIEYLQMVNRHAKKLTARGAAWKLRAELIAYEGSYEEADTHGKKRVVEEGGGTPKQPGVRIGRAMDGLRTLSVTADQRRGTDPKRPSPLLSRTLTSHVPKHCWRLSGTTSKAPAPAPAPV